MDGDGCFSISIIFKKTDTGKKKIIFSPIFQLVMEANAESTINMFKFMVDCEGKIITHKDKQGNVKAIYYRINRIEELNKLLIFFEDYSPRNLVKIKQLNLIQLWFKIKKENKLNDYETVSMFIKKCYYVTDLGKGKGKRKYNVEEALNKTYDWLKN